MNCVADLPTAKRDVQKAKDLLRQAGYGEGKPLSLTMLYQPNQIEFSQIATLFQSNWRDVGVDVKLQATTFPNYTALLKDVKTTPAMSLAYDSARYPDVGVLLNSGYHSHNVEKGSNRSQYANPEVDKLIDAGIKNPDAAARCEDYKKAQKVIRDDYAGIWIANAERPFVARKDISGTGYDPVRQLFDPLALRVGD
jgi:peptide/nickel transport system substrate-binding protein